MIDYRIPEDKDVKARILQMHEFILGSTPRRGSSTTIVLKVAVCWIEQFGVLHLTWGFDNGSDLKLEILQSRLPGVRIGLIDNVSDAGRLAVQWVEEVVKSVEVHFKEVPDLPIQFAPVWLERKWPR